MILGVDRVVSAGLTHGKSAADQTQREPWAPGLGPHMAVHLGSPGT